jgi:hypothetical protein
MHLAILVSLSFVPSLFACECGVPSQRQSFKDATIVFRGRVITIEHLNPVQPNEFPLATDHPVKLAPIPRNHDDQTLVTMDVHTAWKGPATRQMKVFSIAHPSMCGGFAFEQGREYVVYATDFENRIKGGEKVYDLGTCPLRIRMDVAVESNKLGPGHKPK